MKQIPIAKIHLIIMLFAAMFIFTSCKSENDADRMRTDRDRGTTTDDDKDDNLGEDRTMMGRSAMMQSMTAALNTMKEKVSGYSFTGDPDYDYVMIMMPHHQAAIDMGQAYLNEGANAQLKDMVSKDIEKQKKEIDIMKDWMVRQNNYSPGTIDPNYKSKLDKVVGDIKGMNMQVVTDNADISFINTMIPHHQSAIDMSKIHQEYGKSNSIKNLARNIITEQQDDIKMLQDMRTGAMNK